ncbi:LysR substrate-binding domain-containing protein [Paracoccus rhizosphaerae]|uniref:LysR substrate-binding domain-containing protein n=1 Tax=Paracoccus rhizosphaerae TaxID=1133347 RepID=A0ABV6CNG2_9RHOB|nr:LysR substrate-binding domain-containing protein [Paracoccus rhizosphaerae]
MPKPYDLPPLGDLACFEVAARHLSFKCAAGELNVTPAAVSHRIKALEEELGQPLFLRQYRGVELTEAGALLFVALQRGLEGIAESVGRIRNRSVRSGVSIAATTAVSTLWLMPRLAGFLALHPDVALSQVVQDGPVPEGVDLSIRYGDPAEIRDETVVLMRDRILALGTPGFAARHQVHSLEDLARVPLIHTRSDEPEWTTWPDWFRRLGMTEPRGPRFTLNNYLVSLQAAEDNIGAVLGWEALIAPHLRSERLCPLVADALPSPYPFYLRIHGRPSANARLLADWLVAQGGGVA